MSALLAFTASPRFLDVVIVLFVAELGALVAYRTLRRRGMPSSEVVAFRSGQPIRRHSRCHGLINEYRTAA